MGPLSSLRSALHRSPGSHVSAGAHRRQTRDVTRSPRATNTLVWCFADWITVWARG